MTERRFVREVEPVPRIRQWTERPIPWCISHGSSVGRIKNNWQGQVQSNRLHCEAFEGRLVNHGSLDCVISTGGPDHRWWEDVE